MNKMFPRLISPKNTSSGFRFRLLLLENPCFGVENKAKIFRKSNVHFQGYWTDRRKRQKFHLLIELKLDKSITFSGRCYGYRHLQLLWKNLSP